MLLFILDSVIHLFIPTENTPVMVVPNQHLPSSMQFVFGNLPFTDMRHVLVGMPLMPLDAFSAERTFLSYLLDSPSFFPSLESALHHYGGGQRERKAGSCKEVHARTQA